MSVDNLSRPLADRVASLSDPAPPAGAKRLTESTIDGAINALDGGKTHYTDRPGIAPLREWVSKHLKDRYNFEVPAGAITITCGGTEARFVSIKVLAGENSVIYCAGDPSPIAGAAHLCGAKITTDIGDRHITMVYASPHAGKAAMNEIVDMAKAHHWPVIWDIDMGREDYHPAQDPDLAPLVVSIGSLSHALPGWRVGWLAGSEWAAKLRAYKQSMTICSPSISQWAALGWTEGEA